jgi:hypothetical protein
LQVHPEKTKIVYCKDDDRRGNFLHEKFDFLGYSFQARRSKNRWGKFFVNFSPGGSNAATKAIREEIRGRQLRCRIDRWIDDLARMFNPIIRGWITYYGRYYKLLQIGTLSSIALFGPGLGSLGDGEIQTLETTSAKGRAMGSQDCFERPTAVCSLAIVAPCADWTIRAG